MIVDPHLDSILSTCSQLNFNAQTQAQLRSLFGTGHVDWSMLLASAFAPLVHHNLAPLVSAEPQAPSQQQLKTPTAIWQQFESAQIHNVLTQAHGQPILK